MGFLLSLPMFFVGIGTLLGVILVGGLYLFGIFGKAKQDNTKLAEDANLYTIKSLKEKIDILEEKVEYQAKSIAAMDVRMQELITDNKRLSDILQGRDADTQKFQNQGFEVMSQFPEVLALAKSTNQSVSKLCKSIDSLIAVLNVKTTTTTVIQPN